MPSVVDSVRIAPHHHDTYAILLGEQRLGYVRLTPKGVRAPISWLPAGFGGVTMETDERVAVVRRVRELLDEKWAKHEAASAELERLEKDLPDPTPTPSTREASGVEPTDPSPGD